MTHSFFTSRDRVRDFGQLKTKKNSSFSICGERHKENCNVINEVEWKIYVAAWCLTDQTKR